MTATTSTALPHRSRPGLPPPLAPSPAGPPPAVPDDGSVDRLLLLPRAAIGAAAVLVSPLLETSWQPGGVLLGGYLVAVSAVTLTALGRTPDGPACRRLSASVLLADGLAFLASFVLMGATPTGAGMLLFPLLAFELALKLGALGAGLAVAGLVAGIGIRVTMRVVYYELPVRWHIALLVVAATTLTVAVGCALRARLVAEASARAERDRIARSLRATVTELLTAAGVPRGHMDYAGLQQLLDLACTHPEVGPELGRRLAATLEPSPDLDRLTPRETEILGLLADGRTDREIADALFLSRGTVRVHVSNVMRKLGVTDRADAIELMQRRGRRPATTPGPGPSSPA